MFTGKECKQLYGAWIDGSTAGISTRCPHPFGDVQVSAAMNLLFPIDPIKRQEMIDQTPQSSRKEDRENYVDTLIYELQGYYDFPRKK